MIFRGNGGNGVSRVWGGVTGHRKLISRGIMKILQSLNSQVLPRSFGRVSRKRLHDGSECFQ